MILLKIGYALIWVSFIISFFTYWLNRGGKTWAVPIVAFMVGALFMVTDYFVQGSELSFRVPIKYVTFKEYKDGGQKRLLCAWNDVSVILDKEEDINRVKANLGRKSNLAFIFNQCVFMHSATSGRFSLEK